MKNRYFIVDSDIIVGENFTEDDLVEFAYEMWLDDYEHKYRFEEPDDMESALDYLEMNYSIIEGNYIYAD